MFVPPPEPILPRATVPELRRSTRERKQADPNNRPKGAYHASLVGHTDCLSQVKPFELFCFRYSVRQALRSEDIPKRDAALTTIKEELGNVLLMRALKPVMRDSIKRAEMECIVYPLHMFLKDI